MSSAAAVPPELAEIIRESSKSSEPKAAVSRNLQVGCEARAGTACGSLLSPADDPREARAGDGVVPAGVRAADGAGAVSLFCCDAGQAFYRPLPGAVSLFCCDAGQAFYRPLPGASPVLAFDIETTGLTERDAVTCVCAYDPARGIKFARCTPGGEACEEFLALLDEAPLLCAFNGVQFDVPFLAKRWGVSSSRAGRWASKLLDPYEACKLGARRTFSLDKLLAANHISGKTGCGLEAVAMAREGRWDELAEYCMQDTMKTHAAVQLGCLALPAAGCR